MQNRRIWGWLSLVLLLLLWEGASISQIADPFYFPPVHKILEHLIVLCIDGRLLHAVGTSLIRGFAGFGIACLLGVGLGLVAGFHSFVQRLIDPTVEFLRPLPSPALVPVAILFFGIGTQMKIFIVAWACFFPILISTMDGVRSISPALLDTARNLGLDYRRIVWSVLLPAASPGIFTGLRIALAVMLMLVVVAEMVAGNTGIGYRLLEAERIFNVPDMYAYILALALTGYLLNRVFLWIDHKVLAWYHGMNRLEMR